MAIRGEDNLVAEALIDDSGFFRNECGKHLTQGVAYQGCAVCCQPAFRLVGRGGGGGRTRKYCVYPSPAKPLTETVTTFRSGDTRHSERRTQAVSPRGR